MGLPVFALDGAHDGHACPTTSSTYVEHARWIPGKYRYANPHDYSNSVIDRLTIVPYL